MKTQATSRTKPVNDPEKENTRVNLTQADLQRYCSQFRISKDCLALHQLRRVTDKEARNGYGILWNHGDLAGVVFPIFGADGSISIGYAGTIQR